MTSNSNIQYTEVIVIGNGPSGISLSHLLSGHWPFYSGAPHSDEFLQMRLESCQKDISIIQQDLEFLSDGLEGRSSNPVALLFDALTHPDADMGIETPSTLRWEKQKDKVIPHVVLGKADEGGVWQMLDGQVQTLSLGTWMELPGMSFRDWLSAYRSSKVRAHAPIHNHNRASMDEVKRYYMEYVRTKGLTQFFANRSVVTSVERVLDVCHCVDDESGEQVPCSRDHRGRFKWEVRGYRSRITDENTVETDKFYYRAPNVVLATGTFDKPNSLRVTGEHLPYVLHSITELERRISTDLSPTSDPVVIIGAGLSAADAILYALSHDIPVVHVFRRNAADPQIVYKQLPTKLYPEYHRVHSLMAAEESMDGQYKAYPQSCIGQFMSDGKVTIRSLQTNTDIVLQASCAVVLIGSRPDLTFFPGDGKNLGRIPGMSIDSKHNPIDIDPLTYQSTHQPGLFAMGPLTGDNFVRFLRGGALAITAHLWRTRQGLL